MENLLLEGIAAFDRKDYNKAMEILKPLALAGNSEAQCLVGNMYHLGLGVDVDISEAIAWYTKSSDQGYGVASNNLGAIYASSPETATKWYLNAKKQGFSHAPVKI